MEISQIEALNKVVNQFSEEEKSSVESNRFGYIFSKAWLYIKLSFGSITVLLCYYSLFAYIWFVRLFSNFKPFFQHYNRLFLLN